MKRFVLGVSGALLVAVPLISALRPFDTSPALAMRDAQQQPLVGGDSSQADLNKPVHPAVRLTDVIGSNRAVTTFSSLTRMHSSTTTLLGTLSVNTTVLAPLNSAVDSLPRKPWEEENADSAKAFDGPGGKDRADQNLLRFVEAHLVAAGSPWEEGKKAKTVLGRDVWWEEKDGKKVIMPDGVEVDRVAGKAANGEIVSLSGMESG